MQFFKYEACDDALYIRGMSREDTDDQLLAVCGVIPPELVTVTEISESDLPAGEAWLN
ncbi:hypothetical protein [Chromobacterium violaceum]|uniref:hypothetical protein n=1 Tax=Chromobacterium violaceum TaxID=536 RepID=UPI00159609D8|nr:hypothetical protein [Chromobacterium violaceum]